MCWNIVSKWVHLPEREQEGNSDRKKTLMVGCFRHESSLAKSRCSKTRRQFPKTQNWIKHHKINICLFFFDLLYGFWDLIFKWKQRFLPNHRILESVRVRSTLYWRLHLPLLLHTLSCLTSMLELWGRDCTSHFTMAVPPGLSNTLNHWAAS